jgi:hypothetical protein
MFRVVKDLLIHPLFIHDIGTDLTTENGGFALQELKSHLF